MIRNVFLDYKATFKERWDYAWRFGNAGRFCSMFGAAIVVARDGGNGIPIFTYLFLLIISTLISATCMPYLSKPMFLCPMDRQERKQYLRSYYLLNMGFTASIYIIIFGALLLFRQVDIIEFLMVCIGYMALMAISNIKIVCRSNKHKDLWHFGTWKKVSFLLTMLSNVIVIMVFGDTGLGLGEMIAIGIFTALALFFCCYMVIRFLPVMLEVNSVYEQCDRKFYDLELRKITKFEEIDW
ncbi:MAG: hypothetical protein E7287_05215 [Lachnospiraceae bacterium]|nr:hypothetical protein [Lachnospiraceae bacterium]